MKRMFLISLFLFACIGETRAQYPSVNSALSLTGNGYISIPSNTFVNPLQSNYSIDAWVYPTSLSGFQTILGNNYVSSYWLGVAPTGNIRFYPGGGQYYESPGVIQTNRWTHVAVSYNPAKSFLRFYINGVLNGSVNTSFLLPAPSQLDLRIGADRGGAAPDYFWHGYIDEVRLWGEEIDFATADGLLYKTPHAVDGGRLGKFALAIWRLNGNGDDELLNSDGTLVGTGSFIATPDPPHYTRIGAMFLNTQGVTGGSTVDYFDVPHSAGLSLIQNYTLECWVKPSATGGHTQYQTFLFKGSSGRNQWTYWLGLNKANGRVRFSPNGVFASAMESNAAIPTGQWTHVAARYMTTGNTRTAAIFLNGLPAGNANFTVDATPNTLSLLMGRSDESAGANLPYGYSGILDEVRIWNVARSASEIADNYRNEFNGPLAGLEAVYRFDGDIYDASGNGHDGINTLHPSSDAYFINTIDLPSLPSVQVVQPNGGNNWEIGSTQAVTWSATGLINVKIELSRDGGQTYTETIVPSTPATGGSYNWNVTGPETNLARVRITTPTPTSIMDESDKTFTIASPPPSIQVLPQALSFNASQSGPIPSPQKLYITNVGGGTLQWNAVKGTSTWFDLNPSGGASNSDSLEVSITNTALPEGVYTDEIEFQGNAINAGLKVPVRLVITSKQIYSISGKVTEAGAPLPGIAMLLFGDNVGGTMTDPTGAYSFPDLPEGSYSISPGSLFYDFTPSSLPFNPLNQNVTDANFTARKKQGSVKMVVKEGWNLISLPVIPATKQLSSLIPASLSPAYWYSQDSGYMATEELEPGAAYWVKASRADSFMVSGEMMGTREHILLAVHGGWNMVGAPSGLVNESDIIVFPEDVSPLSIYEYDPFIGYFHPVDGKLRPGKGFFVKTQAVVSATFIGTGEDYSLAPSKPHRLPNLRAGSSTSVLLPPLPPR